MLSTQATIGNMKINVQGRDLRELIEQASPIYECPQQCGLCGSKNLGLRFRMASGYDFYEVKCMECEATFAFGQQKKENGGGLFPRGSQDKGEWEKKYERGDHDRDDRGSRDRGRDNHRDDRRGDDRGRGNDRDRGRDDRGGRDDRRGGGRPTSDELREDDPPY